MCSVCNKYKNKYLNIEQVNLLPDEIKQALDNTTFTNNVINKGNALPLLTLIPAIFAGISALTSLAGNKLTEAQDGTIPVERANSIEKATPLEKRTSQSGAITMSDERAMLVEKKTITTFPGLEVLSDDELIIKSIEFLTGEGFSVSI